MIVFFLRWLIWQQLGILIQLTHKKCSLFDHVNEQKWINNYLRRTRAILMQITSGLTDVQSKPMALVQTYS
jgi:hypothetical protein